MKLPLTSLHYSAHLRDLLLGGLLDLGKHRQFQCRYYHLHGQILSTETLLKVSMYALALKLGSFCFLDIQKLCLA